MRAGNLIPQGTDSFHADTWVKIYENELGSAQTSVTISNLDGNTDVMYRLTCRLIAGAGSTPRVLLKPNNDTNSGRQYIYAQDTTVGSARDTSFPFQICVGTNVGDSSLGEALIYAKSGYIRTGIILVVSQITGTTVTTISFEGASWNNTSDNITSLVIVSSQASGLGTGTVIELYKVVPKI